jgi:hypothetical protein
MAHRSLSFRKVPIGSSQGHEGNRHAQLSPDYTKTPLNVNNAHPKGKARRYRQSPPLLGTLDVVFSLPALLRCRLNVPFLVPTRSHTPLRPTFPPSNSEIAMLEI